MQKLLQIIKKRWNGIEASEKTVSEFGYLLSGFIYFIPLIASLLGVWLKHKPFHYWWGWIVIATIILTLNLASRRIITLIYRSAMMIAGVISWFVMRIVLGIFFYVILSPISIILRLSGKDLLNEKMDQTAKSYWKTRTENTKPERYERLF